MGVYFYFADPRPMGRLVYVPSRESLPGVGLPTLTIPIARIAHRSWNSVDPIGFRVTRTGHGDLDVKVGAGSSRPISPSDGLFFV